MLNYNINFSYYKQDYLFENAKMDLGAKDKIALIADIGKGKTTLFEILCGLNNDWQGTINGIFKNEFKKDKQFTFFPSVPVLFENKSVYKNLKYACNVLKLSKPYDNVINDALNEFNIFNLKDVKIKKLTYLQKQTVAFARSFIKNPDVLLIDDLFLNVKNLEEEMGLSKLVIKCLNSDKIVVVASTGFLDKKWLFNKFMTIYNKQIHTFKSLEDLKSKFKELTIKRKINMS